MYNKLGTVQILLSVGINFVVVRIPPDILHTCNAEILSYYLITKIATHNISLLQGEWYRDF